MSEAKTNITNPAAWKECLSNKYLWLMLIILSIATAVRIIFFIGFGLGDDPVYAKIVNSITHGGLQALNLNYGVYYRVGLFLPIQLFFSIFGINDFSFVLYPFLASLGSIIVIYFIGKELFGKETGLIAAILLALCPFDAVFASTMTVDIITSFFTALCVLLFLKGNACPGRKYILYFVLSAVFLFYSYLIKIPSYLILCCLIIVSFSKIKSFKRHLVFYGSAVILLLLSFVADRFLTGDYLNRSHTLLAQCAQPSWDVRILYEYPNWMFKRMYDGSMLFGYYFYLTFPALVYISITRLKQALPVLMWLLVLFLIMEFIPLKFELPYKPSPRFSRYLHAILIPSITILAAGFYGIWRFKKTVFIAALVPFLTSSIIEAHILHKTWKEPFSDVNESSRFLLTLPEKPIYTDHWFNSRFKFDAQYKKNYLFSWYLNRKSFQYDIIEKKDFTELKHIRNAYVVAGGSRGIYVGTFSILNLGDYKPPPNWKLIKEIPKELTSYRKETLKIYDVSPEQTEKHNEHN
jgi:4-amino-4-deoxy-L-arabinose transferase-like glycosyltransferase